VRDSESGYADGEGDGGDLMDMHACDYCQGRAQKGAKKEGQILGGEVPSEYRHLQMMRSDLWLHQRRTETGHRDVYAYPPPQHQSRLAIRAKEELSKRS
jgi:hypothetical protein